MSAMKRQKTTVHNDTPSNLIAVKDVSKDYLEFLLNEAEEMKILVNEKGGDERLKHKILASVFYEVSKACHCTHNTE
jgi:aspartate carbamoyltransferase catalytic subunit